jgi:Predicted membrane protein (DUF2339)
MLYLLIIIQVFSGVLFLVLGHGNKSENKPYSFSFFLASIFLGLVSTILLWNDQYPAEFTGLSPESCFLANPVFISSALTFFLFAIGNRKLITLDNSMDRLNRLRNFFIPVLIFVGLAALGFYEIRNYWFQVALNGEAYKLFKIFEPDMGRFYTVFGFVYVSLLTVLYVFTGKTKSSSNFMLFHWFWHIGLFSFIGLNIIHALDALRYTYMTNSEPDVHIWISFVVYAVMIVLLIGFYKNTKYLEAKGIHFKTPAIIIIFLTLAILLSEAVTQAVVLIKYDSYGRWVSMSHRYPYTILWSLMALVLIGIGMKTKKRVVLFLGIVFFVLSIAKVFIYDLNVFHLT